MSIEQSVKKAWSNEALEGLKNFVALPALNKDFDRNWKDNGYLLQALKEAKEYGVKLFNNATFEIKTIEGATPCLWVEIPATKNNNGKPVFFYGHFDKQPAMSGWSEGLDAFKPVVRDGKLYGRGACDDGYSFYAALTAVKALEENNISHPRITGLFETDEETGSFRYSDYLDEVKNSIKDPAFIAVLDLSSPIYDRLWLTQSLRGVIAFNIQVKTLTKPLHSGAFGNIAPNAFTALRQILERLEDSKTATVNPELKLTTHIPDRHKKKIAQFAGLVGKKNLESLPLFGNTISLHSDSQRAIEELTWSPSLTVLGISGIPEVGKGGALIHKEASAAISFRIPPYVDAEKAFNRIKEYITSPENAPWHATIEITNVRYEEGFDAPEMPDWLKTAWENASLDIFGNPPASLFEGASIGTMNLFKSTFPSSPFVGTGVLGPNSNAHAPDESINLDYVTKLTIAIARIIAAVPEI